jgi:hypothetical protein
VVVGAGPRAGQWDGVRRKRKVGYGDGCVEGCVKRRDAITLAG